MSFPQPTFDITTFVGPANLNRWTTAGRPASPTTGGIGYNSDSGTIDLWNGTGWANPSAFTGGAVPNATTFGATLTAQGVSAFNGATTIGTNAAAAATAINGPVGSQRILRWQTAGSNRWDIFANTTGESGSNAGSDLDILPRSDAGGSLGAMARLFRANGSMTFNPNLNFTDPFLTMHGGSISVDKTVSQTGTRTFTTGVPPGSGGSSPMGIRQFATFTGVLDTGAQPDFNTISTTDTVNASRALPFSSQLSLSHSYNTGANGDRSQLGITYNKNAASLDGLATGPFNIIAFMHADVGESTNVGAPLSRASSVNFDTRIGGTGFAWVTLLCQENDIRVFAGNTVVSKGNISVHWGVSDAVHGSVEDYGISFNASPTIAPATGAGKTLLLIGSYGQALPWDPSLSGTSIMQLGANVTGNLTNGWKPTVTYGLDLWGLSFGAASFRASGITIDGTGQLPVLGPGAITYSSGGIKIAVPNIRAVSAAIAAGGTLYKANDIIVDSMGTLWTVATVGGGGVVTSVTLLQTNYAAAAPTNPVSTSYGTGTGLTLNLTTTTTGTLSLGDSGQTVNIATGTLKVGASQMTANGVVATAMSSLGPAGSHTTIQEWLTVQNSAGTVRYIPCF